MEVKSSPEYHSEHQRGGAVTTIKVRRNVKWGNRPSVEVTKSLREQKIVIRVELSGGSNFRGCSAKWRESQRGWG